MTKRVTLQFLLIILILVWFVSCKSTRNEETIAIINKLNLIEAQKLKYTYQIEPLKYQTTGIDSIRILKLEKQLSDREIEKRISKAFDEKFSDKEINDLYHFIQTSAFDKFFNSGNIYVNFTDIDKEITEITDNLSKTVKKSTKKFEPIPVNRENGFYATVDYEPSETDRDIKLEENPSLTLKDIQDVKKVFNSYNHQSEIEIRFTKKGAEKFYLLTKANIGKPIATVVAKHIISMPIVTSEIIGGMVSISGSFSEKEIDEIIKTLKQEKL